LIPMSAYPVRQKKLKNLLFIAFLLDVYGEQAGKFPFCP